MNNIVCIIGGVSRVRVLGIRTRRGTVDERPATDENIIGRKKYSKDKTGDDIQTNIKIK